MADYVKLRTHITGHVRFLDAGPKARDLYTWGMLWSGQQETDGDIPMTAVMTSAWGAGGKGNVVLAQKLVEVGLWERTETGYRILRWAEQGNMTKAGLDEKRKAERERKYKLRNSSFPPCPAGTPDGTPTGTPDGIPDGCPASGGSFTSTSLSGSDLRSDLPDRSSQPTDPPAWFAGTIETIETQTGEKLRPAEAWLRYSGHRRNKGMAPSPTDAVYWLTTVMVREAREERQAESRQRERDAKWDTKRAGPPNPGDSPPKPTAAESKAFAAELAAQLAARRQKGAA